MFLQQIIFSHIEYQIWRVEFVFDFDLGAAEIVHISCEIAVIFDIFI